MPDENVLEVTPESPPVSVKEEPAGPALDAKDEAELAQTVITGVEHRGEKVVPLKSLKAERQAKAVLRKEVEGLKQQVAEATRVAQHYQQYEPYVPQLAELARQAAEGRTTQPQQHQVDPQIAAVAKELDTTPEIAAKLMAVMERVAGGVVGKAVEPVAGRVASIQSQEMRQRAYGVKGPDGRQYASKEAIDTVFNALAADPKGAALASSPDVANLVLLIARGLDPQRYEPNLSELPGGRGGQGSLSDLDRKAAEMRGISPDRMRELRANDSLELE